MRLLTILAVSAIALGACERRPMTPPSPKTDSVPRASPAAGSTTTPANIGRPSQAERREAPAPVEGQVDARHADQHRDFQSSDDNAGPKSSETQPTLKN
jgi:hypothetical protein